MRYLLGLVITVLVVTCFILFWPTGDLNNDNVGIQNSSSGTIESQIANLDPTEKSDDQRNEIMLAEYKVLEKERRALKQRLARLKHYMWGLKFEKDKAKQMNEVLLNAHKLIKNPDMLGAFSDVKNIRDEIIKIKFINKSLDQVTKTIKQKKGNE